MKDERTNENTRKKRFQVRPMVLVLLGFLCVILLGSLVLATPAANSNGKWLPYIDALFTSTSAVCVTGLVVVPTVPTFSVFGQVVLLLLIQFGGLGFMTITTLIFIMVGKRITLKNRVALLEILGEDQMRGIVRLVRNIALMTGIIEGAGALLLMCFLIPLNGAIGIWQSLFTSVSAFCNAGFDIFDPNSSSASLMGFAKNPGVLIIISTLITLGGFGFTVINDLLHNRFRWRRLKFHSKLVLISSVALFFIGTFFFFGSEYQNFSEMGLTGGYAFLNAMFQSVTARTAGFNSFDQAHLSNAGTILTIVLMFIGASPGGTGGGIKTTTFAILILSIISALRDEDNITISRQTIAMRTVLKTVGILFLALVVIFIAALIISLNLPEVTLKFIIFEIFSAFGTVGLSQGLTPSLPVLSKFVLMVVMLIGRLGVVSFGMLRSRDKVTKIKYPNANPMVG